MATREFFALVADHLTDNGLLVINIIRGAKLFDCMVATIAAVFRSALVFDVPGSGNAIVVASMSASQTLAERVKSASLPSSSLMKDNGVDLVQIGAVAAAPNSTGCANPLTDDFSPTEFLGNQLQK
jgi:spermidine synthase